MNGKISVIKAFEFAAWLCENYKFIDKDCYILKDHVRKENNLQYYKTIAQLYELFDNKQETLNL